MFLGFVERHLFIHIHFAWTGWILQSKLYIYLVKWWIVMVLQYPFMLCRVHGSFFITGYSKLVELGFVLAWAPCWDAQDRYFLVQHLCSPGEEGTQGSRERTSGAARLLLRWVASVNAVITKLRNPQRFATFLHAN